ncbi:helix-turn-helix transcriptional regulator [Catenuloplanes niger JCM 9533]
MSEHPNPVVMRQQLASMLREARHAAGMTIDQVAAHLLCSPAKISRMETGRRPASQRDVRDLCDHYSVDTEKREQMMALAQDGRRRSWWDEYELPRGYSNLIGMEAAASSMRDFKSSTINGLLQTEEYAREVISSYFLPANPALIDQLVAVRMERQRAVLRRDPLPDMQFVLDEAALRRVVGGPVVMEEQLGRLLAITSELPSATIQVLSLRRGAHAAMDTTFTVLDFPPGTPLKPVVHVEDVFGDMKLERQEDVDNARQVFQRAADAALSPGESRELLEEIRAQYEREQPPER